MACGDYSTPIEYWINWQFTDGAVCWYADVMGLAPFFFLFYGVTFLALYQASGSMMMPVVVLIALAPIIMVLIPAIGVQFVAVIMLIMTAIGGFWLYMRLGV